MSDEKEIETTQVGGDPTRAALHWVTGVNTIRDAQKAFAAEMMLNASEMVERFRTETHLWNELVSKMAGSHSVKDFATAWQECGHHQIEFARREVERFLDHGQHVLDVTTGLLKSAPAREKDAE